MFATLLFSLALLFSVLPTPAFSFDAREQQFRRNGDDIVREAERLRDRDEREARSPPSAMPRAGRILLSNECKDDVVVLVAYFDEASRSRRIAGWSVLPGFVKPEKAGVGFMKMLAGTYFPSATVKSGQRDAVHINSEAVCIHVGATRRPDWKWRGDQPILFEGREYLFKAIRGTVQPDGATEIPIWCN